jgi:hypothetical protein
MTSSVTNNVKAAALIALALAIGAMGISVAYTDDPSLPGLGPAGIGMLLMAVGVVLGVTAARNKLPTWAARSLLAVGVLIAVVAAFLIHGVAVIAPLFPQPRDMPSVIDSAPSPQYASAVERARELVRAASEFLMFSWTTVRTPGSISGRPADAHKLDISARQHASHTVRFAQSTGRSAELTSHST